MVSSDFLCKPIELKAMLVWEKFLLVSHLPVAHTYSVVLQCLGEVGQDSRGSWIHVHANMQKLFWVMPQPNQIQYPT